MKSTILGLAVVAMATTGFSAAIKSDTVMTPRPDDKSAEVSLKGRWQVAYWPFDRPEEQLVAVACDDSKWKSRQQPGKIFYLDPDSDAKRPKNFSRVTLAHIDENDGAVLRRKVMLPPSWKGKKVFLRFDAVYPAAAHFLNGEKIGEHMSGMTPVQYDVTDLVRPGEETLVAVRLYRRHKFVQLDMPRHSLEFGGLSQDARFFAVDPLHIADYHLVSSVEDGYRDGRIAGTVTVRNDGSAAAKGTLELHLKGKGQRDKAALAAVPFEVAAGASADVKLDQAVENVALWNDERPNLYDLRLALVAGEANEEVSFKTGFRKLELSPSGAKLNGNPVKFRGVNHLTFNPDTGLYTPKSWLRESLSLMKKANVNCIRTHYAGPDALQELCDEMGFYLIQEIPIDWGTHFIHLDEWIPPSLMRIEAVIRRDRHHPCVMSWAIGNENMPETKAVSAAGWANLQKFEDLANRLDPFHDQMFPPPGPANKIKSLMEIRFGTIGDTHYSFKGARELVETGKVKNPNSWEAEKDNGDFYTITKEEALKTGWKGVWFSSEWGIFNNMPDILNAPYADLITDCPTDPLCGDACIDVLMARLNREWGFMRDEPSCLGGAYFPWLCSGAGKGKDGNPWGYVSWGESADWGVVTADLLPKPSFWALRKAYAPVAIPKRLYLQPGATSVVFKARNFYNSYDLSECTLRVNRSGGGTWMSMMNSFIEVPMKAAPGELATIEIPLSKGLVETIGKGGYAFLRCWFLDPKGFRSNLEDIFVFAESEREKRESAAKSHPSAKNAAKEFMPVGPDGEKQ